MQPQGHAQIVINLIDFEMNLQEAGDAPRIQHGGSSQPTGEQMTDGGILYLETGIDYEVIRELAKMGHKIQFNVGGYGGYQAIMWDDNNKVYYGASELFTHRRNKRTVKTTLLREWAAEISDIPLWLFEDSYHIVGDLAETISLVVPNNISNSNKSLTNWIHEIEALKNVDDEDKKSFILKAWSTLDQNQRFLFNKLITGGFRIGVSKKSVTKALSKFTNIEENTIAHRLMGNWHADDITFDELIINASPEDDLSKPYPFYLAYALENEPEELGDIKEWQAEWKWDGMKDGKPLDFHQLQTRLNRKTVSKKHLTDTPISIIAYDIMECKGQDIREKSMEDRRSLLEEVVQEINNEKLSLSPIIENTNWEDLKALRETSREMNAEGLMLKRLNSPYKSGRKKGDWWKWKVDPMTIDAVMIYAQRGHGRRSNLFSDFTFAVWDEHRLVPFAKAYSGLTDVELKEITSFVKKNAIERFGPVTSVNPGLVFELDFEGIAESKRHKSGIALRFPRVKKWRKDKLAKEANTLEDLKVFLKK